MRKCHARKRRLWRKIRANKDDTMIRLQYRECVHQWRSLIQQQQMRTEKRLIESNNIGSFFKFVNRRTSNQADIGPIITPDNTTLTTDKT